MALRDYIIPSLATTCIIILLITGPVSQDPGYHNFADTQELVGIRNFLNVISNLPFAIISLLGLWRLRKVKQQRLKHIICTLFIAFLLLTFGSGYYHLRPNNETLVYDRLPMVIIFMSFFSFIIHDRIDQSKGYRAFIVLNLVGILSVIYWIVTEHAGNGDLRWYGMIQFFPLVAIPLILIFYKSSFNHAKEIISIFIFFGVAKLTETFDKDIYEALNESISGHSLKHLFMAAAEYLIVLQVERRVKW
ncbi:MAG TPA: ceramidase domain-containing protein [Segetibacter sp.]